MRAREPDISGTIDRDGVRIAYEVFGAGEPAIVFPPVNPVVHGLAWKAQVPYLARRSRVVVIDPRGNGRSDRPTDPAAYGDLTFMDDTVAVMDALAIPAAVLVGLCSSVWSSILQAVHHPERVLGVVALAPLIPFLTPQLPHRAKWDFDAVLHTDEGWAKYNRHYWLRDYPGFLRFFFDELLPEPHSSKQREDCVRYGLQSTAEAQVAYIDGPISVSTADECRDLLSRVNCPVLVVHGDDDRCQPASRAEGLAEITGATRILLHGAGHLPQAREPVMVNLAIRDFLRRLPAPAKNPPAQTAEQLPLPGPKLRSWTRPSNRPRRVLYLSSPIGLGHARRDLAIARALRHTRPGVEIDWLAQHPVTRFFERSGERIHPASAFLASESAHIESESGEHDLHAFQAVRSMDEVLVANFMVFSDLVEDEQYDLWVGDESWELDHFLHENPELKTTAYSWLTDFVGWLPVGQSGSEQDDAAEAKLTADYNAEMLEQIDRLPRVRDHSLFVGNPGDVADVRFGPALPAVREWVAEHYQFTGYITGFDRQEIADRPALRQTYGFEPGEPVCVVAVGGSGVGVHLLRRCIAAYPEAARRIPGLRMVVVTGPRIDPAGLSTPIGVEITGYVEDLHRMLAAADLAVVQGGLSTTMELAAAGRPFIYVPLRRHFEQNIHVRHRLANYNAGRCLLWEETDPGHLAEAIAQEIGRKVNYRPVEDDGATRAAALLSELF